MRASDKVVATPAMRPKVLVAEAQALMAEAMENAIRGAADMTFAARCSAREQVAQACALVNPDVAVLDVSIYRHDFKGAVCSVRRQARTASILLVVPEANIWTYAKTLLAGADNCLSRLIDRASFVHAIRATLAGESLVPSGLRKSLLQAVSQLSAEGTTRLSDREVEVMRLAADGLSATDIASRLHVSISTARTHLVRSYRKLGAHNRSGAVARAMRSGMLEQQSSAPASVIRLDDIHGRSFER